MSFILNAVKEKVSASILVEVEAPKINGQSNYYPINVTDKSQSITADWKLTYNASKSTFKEGLYASKGRFNNITIPRFSRFGMMLLEVYSKFLNDPSVVDGYIEYLDIGPNLQFTAIRKEKGLSITMTVTDDTSPFHMIAGKFFVMPSKLDGQPYIVGSNGFFDAATDIWADRDTFEMLPAKNPVIKVVKDKNSNTYFAKAHVLGAQNGQIAVSGDRNHTEIDFVAEMVKSHRMLAGIYEKTIMEIAFDQNISQLPAAATHSFNQNGANMGAATSQWFGNTPASGMSTMPHQGQPQNNPFGSNIPQGQQQQQQANPFAFAGGAGSFAQPNQGQPTFNGPNTNNQSNTNNQPNPQYIPINTSLNTTGIF